MNISELNNLKVDALMADEFVNSKTGSDLMVSCGIKSGGGSCGR